MGPPTAATLNAAAEGPVPTAASQPQAAASPAGAPPSQLQSAVTPASQVKPAATPASAFQPAGPSASPLKPVSKFEPAATPASQSQPASASQHSALKPAPSATAWFANEFGFDEESYEETRAMFEFKDNVLTSKANNRSFFVGPFDFISCGELRVRYGEAPASAALGGLKFQNLNGDVKLLHRNPSNKGAVFQVASQFNCLEMLEPDIGPEHGITNYARDKTQGPACALSCPGATVFRNYFVNGRGQGEKQLDGLAGVAALALVDNARNKHWKMLNGYCLPAAPGSIANFSQSIKDDSSLLQSIAETVKVGVHWETEVVGGNHRVAQVFCSALPVSKDKANLQLEWEPFARVVLRAAFEATFLVAAILAGKHCKRVQVYLTALGGGAFGNRLHWIADVMKDAMCQEKILAAPLDIFLVHFGTTVPKKEFLELDKAMRNITEADNTEQTATSVEQQASPDEDPPPPDKLEGSSQ